MDKVLRPLTRLPMRSSAAMLNAQLRSAMPARRWNHKGNEVSPPRQFIGTLELVSLYTFMFCAIFSVPVYVCSNLKHYRPSPKTSVGEHLRGIVPLEYHWDGDYSEFEKDKAALKAKSK